ncbi:hypothetical protein [Ornithinimicrobium cerasi]|uniref:hypothetical protein n=1 Tax=Ornithinimicrobium cerasi TaxID=2248773 RepID=UPI000EFEE9D5|nr:hypothetical protein [Ornithinimicrobium cerasi]
MTVPARELRAWAEGDYPTEAAVEILIRAKAGRFARDTCPWIEPLGPTSSLYRVDWDRLHQEAGVFSGGERRILNLAASMGSPDHPVDLSNDLCGLDDDLLLLVLAATAHAAGRPRLLSPATAVATRPAPRTVNPRESISRRAGRRPEDERWVEHAPAERHEGPRP